MIPDITDLMDSSERDKHSPTSQAAAVIYHRYTKKLSVLLVHLVKLHAVHTSSGVLLSHIMEHI